MKESSKENRLAGASNRQLPQRPRNPKRSVPADFASRSIARAAVIHDGLKFAAFTAFTYTIINNKF